MKRKAIDQNICVRLKRPNEDEEKAELYTLPELWKEINTHLNSLLIPELRRMIYQFFTEDCGICHRFGLNDGHLRYFFICYGCHLVRCIYCRGTSTCWPLCETGCIKNHAKLAYWCMECYPSRKVLNYIV